MDLTPPPFGQEEMQPWRQDRDHHRDGRLKIRFLGRVLLAKHPALAEVAFLLGRRVATRMNGGPP